MGALWCLGVRGIGVQGKQGCWGGYRGIGMWGFGVQDAREGGIWEREAGDGIGVQ